MKGRPRNDWTGAVLKTPITGDLRNRARQLGRHASPGKGDVMGIRSAKFFLAIGITFAAVLALIVGVMMWSGQQHLAKLKAHQRAHEGAIRIRTANWRVSAMPEAVPPLLAA
jgi:hypothetical protein